MPITKSVEQPQVVQEEVVPVIVNTPAEVEINLFEVLEVWGSDVYDQEVKEKVKFISGVLGGDKKDAILSISTELGSTPMGTSKLDRIYKYLRLKEQANKVLEHHKILEEEMKTMKTGIKSNWRTNQWD